MSPATAVIAVERYIGSCLISSSPPYVSPAYSASKKDRVGAGAYRFPPTAPAPIRDFYRQPPPGHHQPPGHHHQPPPWMLPPPSPSNGLRRHGAKDDVRRSPNDAVAHGNKEDLLNRSPLSRLAIHTQGAPLIQAQRQSGRKPGGAGSANRTKPHGGAGAGAAANPKSGHFAGARAQAEETPNENCLPRIIKPRKRRKKDRKPPPASPPEPSIVTLKPYTPLCQEFDGGPKGGAEDRQTAEPADDALPGSDGAPAHEPAVPGADEEPARCCCRYCDPAGSVWDSPAVPLPPSSDEWSTLQVSSEIITSPNGHRDIEIKFFSTAAPGSPPPAAVPSPSAKSSVSPPWP